MSQNHPFFFSAGSGYVPPPQPQQNQSSASNALPLQASAVPTQQAAHQSAQVAGMDMSALEGISPERLAAIARLFQSGALQMPPPAPSVPAQVPPAGPSSSTSAQPLPSTAHDQQRTNLSTERNDVDMDAEEGEVDESEESSTPAKVRDFLRPPPTGPRNRSVSPRERLQSNGRKKSSPKPPPFSKAMSDRPTSQHSQIHHPGVKPNGKQPTSNYDAAKMFVLEMVNAGYSYEDIARDVRNRKSLARMFRELRLPTPNVLEASQSSQQNGTVATTSAPPQASDAKLSPVEATRKTSLTKRPAPAKPAPVDRSEYLARLQAAKNKKVDTNAASSEPHGGQPNAQPIQKTVTPTQNIKPSPPPASGGATSASQPLSAEKKASMTELARRKLEALRARKAAEQSKKPLPNTIPKPPSSEVDPQTMPNSSQGGLGAGIADISTQLVQGAQTQPVQTGVVAPQTQVPTQQAVSPTPPTPSRAFGNLPGLFMFDSLPHAQVSALPQQALTASQPPVQTTTSPRDHPTESNVLFSGLQTLDQPTTTLAAPPSTLRKRPVASDFDDPSANPSSVKRLFGQSRNGSEDESLVIQVSEDEDENDTMDVEDTTRVSNTGLQTKSFRDVGPLRDFPPKPSLQAQSSAPATPGGVAYQQKMKEIEEFKRRIAEKEKRQRESGKATPIKSDAPAPITPSPAVPAVVLVNSDTVTPIKSSTPTTENKSLPTYTSPIDSLAQAFPQADTPVHSRSASTDRPKSAAQLAKERERDILRKRLLELEQDDVEDLSEVVEVPEMPTDPDHVMSGALPDPLSFQGSLEGSHVVQIEQELQAPDSPNDSPHSEEGEVSDDSMSNLYDLQGRDGAESQSVSPLDNGRDGSDASTVGALSDSVVETKQADTAPAFEPQIQDARDSDSAMADAPTSQASMTTAVESQAAETVVEDLKMYEEAYDPATVDVQEDLTPNVSLDEDESEDDSSEDNSDLDDGLESTYMPNEATDAEETLRAGVPENGDQITPESFRSASPIEAQAEQAEPLVSESGRVDTKIGSAPDDDLAPELQPSHKEQTPIADQTPAEPKSYFTPYRSPLASFKDYRYHPDYLNTVSGGYKSVTYSHNIDSEVPLCPFETAGGKCNDKACQYQHFKSMFVSDNELLKIMGTKDVPAHTPEEVKRWNEGLGAVVRELRTTNLGKDASAIAARIAQFRRDFVGDPTKILNLG